MLVEMRCSAAGLRFSLRPGDVVELSDFEGQRLINRGMAVLVEKEEEESKPAPAKPKPKPKGKADAAPNG